MYKLIITTFLAAAFCARVSALQLEIPAITATKIDAGFYAEGTELSIAATGTTSLYSGYFSRPDGSLASSVSSLDSSRFHSMASSSNYPTIYGGDGVNHFIGGGLNFVPNHGTVSWPVAGKRTTDTRNPATIRFGALIGTFSESPNPEDWFCVGFGRKVKVPPGGAYLYLMVNDSAYADNSGSYAVTVEVSADAHAEETTGSAPVYTLSPRAIELPQDRVFGWVMPSGIGLSDVIESSPDLLSWARATNITFFFKDMDSPNSSRRFYRFVKP